VCSRDGEVGAIAPPSHFADGLDYLARNSIILAWKQIVIVMSNSSRFLHAGYIHEL